MELKNGVPTLPQPDLPPEHLPANKEGLVKFALDAHRQFDRKFMIARGVLPGGVDDVYLPKNIPQIKR